MFYTLIFLHSLFRWLVLLSLIYAVYRSLRGYRSRRKFSRTDNAVRHWTATIAHIQLMLGMLVYTQSPLVRHFWKHTSAALRQREALFYGLIHFLVMMTAIVLLTIGSAMATRKTTDRDKFRTMLTWFALALLLILAAIPWPFSPFSGRPYLR